LKYVIEAQLEGRKSLPIIVADPDGNPIELTTRGLFRNAVDWPLPRESNTLANARTLGKVLDVIEAWDDESDAGNPPVYLELDDAWLQLARSQAELFMLNATIAEDALGGRPLVLQAGPILDHLETLTTDEPPGDEVNSGNDESKSDDESP